MREAETFIFESVKNQEKYFHYNRYKQLPFFTCRMTPSPWNTGALVLKVSKNVWITTAPDFAWDFLLKHRQFLQYWWNSDEATARKLLRSLRPMDCGAGRIVIIQGRPRTVKDDQNRPITRWGRLIRGTRQRLDKIGPKINSITDRYGLVAENLTIH